MTNIEAVNKVLIAAGQNPVSNSVVIDQNVAASSAWRVLMEASRLVQSATWNFNRSFNRRFDPTSEGVILIPHNMLQANFDGGRYVIRGGSLYDRYQSTFTFTNPVTAREVVELLDWDSLAYQAQHYIACRASSEYAAPRLGTAEAKQIIATHERESLINLQQYDTRLADPNAVYSLRGTVGKQRRRR